VNEYACWLARIVPMKKCTVAFWAYRAPIDRRMDVQRVRYVLLETVGLIGEDAASSPSSPPDQLDIVAVTAAPLRHLKAIGIDCDPIGNVTLNHG